MYFPSASVFAFIGVQLLFFFPVAQVRTLSGCFGMLLVCCGCVYKIIKSGGFCWIFIYFN